MLQAEDSSHDMINLNSAKHFVGSERVRPKKYKLFNKTEKDTIEHQNEFNIEMKVTKSLELVRQEIRNYLQQENETPTAKILKVISNVYENNLSLKDFEIKRLISYQDDYKGSTLRDSHRVTDNFHRGKIIKYSKSHIYRY